jgi:hypothetical protein
MHAPHKYAEKLLCIVANIVWHLMLPFFLFSKNLSAPESISTLKSLCQRLAGVLIRQYKN